MVESLDANLKNAFRDDLNLTLIDPIVNKTILRDRKTGKSGLQSLLNEEYRLDLEKCSLRKDSSSTYDGKPYTDTNFMSTFRVIDEIEKIAKTQLEAIHHGLYRGSKTRFGLGRS